MAANFWESTQRRNWQFTKDQLASMRQRLEDEDPGLVQMFPLPQLRHLSIYFNQQVNRLGKRLSIRQQALATAQVYLKRLYTKVEIRRTNPYLVITTAVYLACKMEESPQHIRMITSESRGLWPEFLSSDASKIGECEFFLISEMSSNLIIHQPYRTLSNIQGDFNLSQDEVALASSVINDHYMTDLPLLYPPHVVALTAVLLALVLRPSNPGSAQSASGVSLNGNNVAAAATALAQAQGRTTGNGVGTAQGGDNNRLTKVQRFAAWLAESSIDIEAMVDCTQELIAFYECHEQYNDKLTREQINRYVKARGLEK